MSLLAYLHRVAEREHLSTAEAFDAMQIILSGQAGPAQIAAFLTALHMRGETVDELTGFARAMRQMAAQAKRPLPKSAVREASQVPPSKPPA